MPRAIQKVSEIDRTRYLRWRNGLSPEEQAARESKRVDTIQQSIERVRIHNEKFSAESAEVAVREMSMGLIDEVTATMREGLQAMTMRKEMVIGEDGTAKEEMRYVQDMVVRLKTQAAIREWLQSVQPRQPAFQLNQQFNNGQAPALHGGTLSTESIIREIRQQRGLAITAGDEPQADAIIPTEVDMELEDDIEEAEDEDAEEGDE